LLRFGFLTVANPGHSLLLPASLPEGIPPGPLGIRQRLGEPAAGLQ